MKGLGSAFIGLSKYLGASATPTLLAPGLVLRSDDPSAAQAPTLALQRNSPSPSDGDSGGSIDYEGNNDVGVGVTYARTQLVMNDVTSGTEDAELRTYVMSGGALINDAITPCPRFKATRNNVDQNVPSLTTTKINFSTEVIDVGGYYAGSAWTPPAGDYLLTAQVTFTDQNAVENELIALQIKQDGVTIGNVIARRVQPLSQTITGAVMVSTDGTNVYEVWAQKNGAGTGQIDGSTQNSFFSGQRIQ